MNTEVTGKSKQWNDRIEGRDWHGRWSGLKRRRECRLCTLVEAENEERFILRYEGEVEEGR